MAHNVCFFKDEVFNCSFQTSTCFSIEWEAMNDLYIMFVNYFSSAGTKFNFAHFFWISRHTNSFKTIFSESFWQGLIYFSIFFLVSFTNVDNKFMFIGPGILSYLGNSLFWKLSVEYFYRSVIHWLPQAYHHASYVIHSLSEEEINVNFLVQLDKLILILETPIFAYLRFQVCLFNNINESN